MKQSPKPLDNDEEVKEGKDKTTAENKDREPTGNMAFYLPNFGK